MILLDTNVVSELMRRQPEPAVVAWLDAQEASTVYISVITEADLHFGVALLPEGRRRDRLAAELDKMLSDQRYIFDAAERKAAWQKVQERYVGMAYSAILYEGKYVAAMREEVQGVTLNVVGFHHLQEIWLEE